MTQAQQPAALVYAERLEDFYMGIGRLDATGAAAELRCLLAENEQLRAQVAANDRRPLTNARIDELHGESSRGFDIEREHYFKAFRDAEAAHNITHPTGD